jgi:ankyrin repeat protein
MIEATLENNLSEVRRLLRAEADVNAIRTGLTPLIAASFHGHVQVLANELLDHEADLEAKDNRDMNHLHWLGNNGHLAVVIELLGHGAEIHANDSNITASILGKRKRRGSNTEAKNLHGDTPLHYYASMRGLVAIVQAILAARADCRVANNDGQLPIQCAVSFRNSKVSKHLLQKLYATIRRLPLHELLKYLTRIGNPNINVGVPPLRAALHQDVLRTYNVVDIVEYLLVGRNPELLSSRDQDGSLPLHVA